MINEELIDEQKYLHLGQLQQEEYLARYCSGIEGKIQSAQTVEEAKSIADYACTEFERSCSSRILRHAAKQHLQILLRKYWEEQ